MSNTTLSLADRFLPLLCGGEAGSDVEKIGPGRYIFSGEATASKTVVTAADVVGGVLTWAAETLDDMAAGSAHVRVARVLLAGQLDDAIDLGAQLVGQERLGILNRIQRGASRSGNLATLHRPSAPVEVAVTI